MDFGKNKFFLKMPKGCFQQYDLFRLAIVEFFIDCDCFNYSQSHKINLWFMYEIEFLDLILRK